MVSPGVCFGPPAWLVSACLLLTAGRLGAQAERVTFALDAPDSGFLLADLYGTGTDGVILIGHGGYSTRASWARLGVELADSGFLVLAFETQAALALRDGTETACLYDAPCMARDVWAAARYLRSRGVLRLTLIGGSAGGGAAAEAATDTAAGITNLVLLAPMAIDHPDRVSGRKLVVVGREDRGAGDRLRLPRIQAQYDRLPAPKEMLRLRSAAHGQRLLEPPTGRALRVALFRFLCE